MKVDRRGLFKAIVGTGAAFGLALGGCAADNSDAKDAAASSGGSSGSGSGGGSGGSGGGSGSGGSGSGGSKAGSGGAGAQDAKVVTDTFKGWATGVPCRA
jgi:hypothetical protein